ncbi:hypothetical protein ABW21_db0203747 [Orbilia brochopaga]|nr:hypothetical protein ABW21_db0203747 [Drechslerella brochopaga]
MEVVEPAPRSLAERRAALEMAHIRSGTQQLAPAEPPRPRPRGPPPPPPANPPRARTGGPPPLPARPPPKFTPSPSPGSSPRSSNDDPPAGRAGAPPLPPRTKTFPHVGAPSKPPPLPVRVPSSPVVPRIPRTPTEKETSTHKLPPVNAVPPKISDRPWDRNKAPQSNPSIMPPIRPMRSHPAVPSIPKPALPESPRRVPSLPPPQRPADDDAPKKPQWDPRRLGFGGEKGKLPSPPRTPEPSAGAPPPLPMNTKPPIPMNTKPKPGGQQSLPVGTKPISGGPHSYHAAHGVCLKCRDFSQADAHAARFPRHDYDDVQRLALDLTTPFESKTDKARVLFTWLHHNVVYDVQGFFNNNIKPSTPASTLKTGLAVCEGYAGLFAAMAIFAGLEAVVVGGHGKGFGWTETDKSYVPPFKGNHAWNACRIDGDEWHLIDPCWGSGHLNQQNTYSQVFDPQHFTGTNEEFGRRHYPAESEYQFLYTPRTWEQYFMLQEEGPKTFSHMTDPEFNYGKHTAEPRQRVLSPYQGHNFRLTGICEHTPATTQWILMLYNGKDEEIMVSDGRGGLVGSIAAGAPGSTIQIRAIHTFKQRSGKGLTRKEWDDRHKGGWSCSYVAICEWVVG